MKVRTMRGQTLDMARLMAQNATKVALGNASMNARGDIVDGKRIVKPREEIAREYHRSNPKAVKQVALRDLQNEIFITPAEAVKEGEKKSKRKLADNS